MHNLTKPDLQIHNSYGEKKTYLHDTVQCTKILPFFLLVYQILYKYRSFDTRLLNKIF
jgi:hypothetical protein